MSKRHERLLFRYSSALERGDFETIAAILGEAERDAALAHMIDEINDAYSAETAGSTNHLNAKDYPMMTTVYQHSERAKPRSHRGYSLSLLVAAVALVALVGAMIVTMRGSNLGSGGDNLPPAGIAQGITDCVATVDYVFDAIPLYSRPTLDSSVIARFSSDGNLRRNIHILDAALSAGETWYFIRVSASPDQPQGWLTQAQFAAITSARCAPLAPTMPPLMTPTLFLPTAVPPSNIMQPTVAAPPVLDVLPERTICTGEIRTVTDVLSLPSPTGVILGTLPVGARVAALDTEVFMLTEGSSDLWYFVAASNLQGWIPVTALESCPRDVAQYPQITPMPLLVSFVQAQALGEANLRAEPNAESQYIGTIRARENYNVIGRYQQWIQLEYPPGSTGSAWVFEELVSLTGDTASIPQVTPGVDSSLYFEYAVQSGDTLFSIMQQFDLDPRLLPEILRVNALEDARGISTGDMLLLPMSPLPDDQPSTFTPTPAPFLEEWLTSTPIPTAAP